jgi:hypothetical protein
VLIHIELQPAASRLIAPVDDRTVQHQPVRQHHAQCIGVLRALQIVAIRDACATGTGVAQQYRQFESRQFDGRVALVQGYDRDGGRAFIDIVLWVSVAKRGPGKCCGAR